MKNMSKKINNENSNPNGHRTFGVLTVANITFTSDLRENLRSVLSI